jgi:hypothetical protein
MKKARINQPKYVHYFDANNTVTSTSLLAATVLDEADATQHTLTFTQVAAVPNLYISSAFTPLKSEHYRIVYAYSGAAVLTEYLDVGSHPVPEFPLGVAQDLIVNDDAISGGLSEAQVWTLTISEAFVASNTIDMDINGVSITSVPFNTDSDTTLADLAVQIAAVAAVTTAVVTTVVGAVDNDRVITVTAASMYTPLVFANVVVAGGATQPDISLAQVASGLTVTVKVFGSDGVEDATVAAAYDTALAGYKAAHTFSTADDYFVVWLKEIGGTPTPVVAQAYAVREPTDKQTVYITASTLSGNNGNPHIGTTVIASDADGNQSDKAVTASDGSCVLQLLPGTYTISLIKTGSVYSKNNVSVVIVDTDTDTGNNTFILITEVYIPTVSDPATPASLSLLTLQLFKMNGTPLKGADVVVTLVTRPLLFSGAGVFDTKTVYVTDANGYLEFSLVQGIEVEVVIVPLSLRRVITVPADAGPNNLLTSMSTANDPMDIIVPNIPAAPSRTL